jgi:pimeloyl-ACP methyl ester carboxylesterase
MEATRQRYGSADYKNASGRLREVLVATVNESYEEELQRVRVPVVMVWGELDDDVPVDVARRAAALLPTPPILHVLRGVGHLVPTLDPRALVASAREALA